MITLNNLTLGRERHPAVHHVNLTLMKGSLTALVGPNGAGKSTLLKAIAGLLKPLQGSITLSTLSSQEIAYCPQDVNIDREFPISVFDMVAMGLWHQIGSFRPITQELNDKIQAAIAAIGLIGLEDRLISTLSEGQLHRALFARLLLQETELILLDEPFSTVDMKTVEDMLGLIQQWHKSQRTIIAALHDLHTVKRYFPDTLILARELVAFGPTAEVLTPDNLQKAHYLCRNNKTSMTICRYTP